MSIYLREQSAGEILRGTVSIYFRNFLPLFGMYFLPTFPIVMLKLKIWEQQWKTQQETLAVWWFVLWVVNWMLATPFAAAALTVGVSDVCLSNRPSLWRSLRRVFGSVFGKLILTNLFVFLFETAAFFPLAASYIGMSSLGSAGCLVVAATGIIGGAVALLLIVWWMFAPTIVVLEGIFGWKPLKRSKLLGKGYYLRNCGVLFLLYFPTLVLNGIVRVTLQNAPNDIFKAFGATIECIFAPLVLIATVLLYYDLRARSEGYDLAMLGQDLRR